MSVFLLGLSALGLLFFSTIESAYEETSDVGLRILRGETRASRRETFFIELLEHRIRFRMTLMLGLLISAAGLAISLHLIILGGFAGPTTAYTFVFVTLLSFLVSQFVPRFFSQNNPSKVLLTLIPAFKPYYRVASLLVMPFAWVLERNRREPVEESFDEDDALDTTMSDIQAFIEVGAEEGIIEASDGAMIQSIMEFGERVVGEVMTPRTQMISLSLDATVAEARDLIVASKHSRFPVFRGDIDQIEGILYVRDLVGAWADGLEEAKVSTVMRTAYFVPEVKPVADLLEEMRKTRVQIAVVIDEYGSVAGIVTIEDLLEEIVGEIEDEDDESAGVDELVRQDDGTILVKGSTEIRKIELEFAQELEADDFTTVAGLINNELGRVARPGQSIERRGISFEVVEADSTRVLLVKLHRVGVEEEPVSKEAAESE